VTRTTGTGARGVGNRRRRQIPPDVDLPLQSTLMFGATWQMSNGFFLGGGIDWSAKAEDRDDLGIDSDDNLGRSSMAGAHRWHPAAGRPLRCRPPLPPPALAPQHTLTVDAQCNLRTVEVGATSKVVATAQDSIDAYLPGSGARPSRTRPSRTVGTAPNTASTVPVTVGDLPDRQRKRPTRSTLRSCRGR
jgi:hypothetical protein